MLEVSALTLLCLDAEAHWFSVMTPSLLLLEKQKCTFEVGMCGYLNTVCVACLHRQDTLLCAAPVVGDCCALKADPEDTLFLPSCVTESVLA